MKNYLFCFNLVGLSPLLLNKLIEMPHFSKLMKNGQKADLNPVFPGLTLPAQASFSTGTPRQNTALLQTGFTTGTGLKSVSGINIALLSRPNRFGKQ